MCILMMFNEQRQISYHGLLQGLQLTDIELKPHLIPLCQGKILLKNPTGKEFKMDDIMQVNMNYHNNLIKIKVPVMHSKVQKNAEQVELSAKVEDDRKHIVDATIVKVMKSHKKIDHNKLIKECIKILSSKFLPDP